MRALPASHAAWDELAVALPDLHRTLQLRDAVEGLPLLSAAAEDLDARYLLRASCLLGIVAHALERLQPRGAASPGLPAVIGQPWATVNRRLGRPQPMLTYIDLIAYNWRLVRSHRPVDIPGLRMEHLRLLVPTVDTTEERVFYLTQTEILARSAPLVTAVVRAQEAAVGRDRAALADELAVISDRLREVTYGALPRIDPMPDRVTHVDPVSWAKTVAPLAVPLRPGVPGPSGTSSPLFHLLDVFFGRRAHGSLLGREALHLRAVYPPVWRAFFDALGAVDVLQYVADSNDRGLQALCNDALRAYAGDDGFLARHRAKVYGYLETAFKVGRDVTIGGFAGLFRDRTWDEVDDALDAAQRERPEAAGTATPGWQELPVVHACEAPTGTATVITLDARGRGIRHQPGDRLEVAAEQPPTLVAELLAALQAGGDEPVLVDAEWRAALRCRAVLADGQLVPLATLLRFGRVNPLAEEGVQALQRGIPGLSVGGTLASPGARPPTLLELVDRLRDLGVDPAVWWRQADRRLSRLVRPELPRLYSIASYTGAGDSAGARTLRLLVGTRPPAPNGTIQKDPPGATASSFLARVARGDAGAAAQLTVRVSPSPSLRLPEDASTPIVLFAAGTGVAPFLAFLEQRRSDPAAGPAWLLASVRVANEMLLGPEFAEHVAAGRLRLDVVCSRQNATVALTPDGHDLQAVPAPRSHIDVLMRRPDVASRLSHQLCSRRAGGAEAVFYVCGPQGFADTVAHTLDVIAPRQADAAAAGAPSRLRTSTLRTLTAENRLRCEVHAGAAQPDAAATAYTWSEVARHNDDDHGYWLVIDGLVHDVTEFTADHPGGAVPLRAYAGMDATNAYRQVGHHRHQQQQEMLRHLRIGRVRTADLFTRAADQTASSARPPDRAAHRCWVGYLHLVVEMQNALSHDDSTGYHRATPDDDPHLRSPLQLRLLLDIQHRFVHGYLPALLGEQFDVLNHTTFNASPNGVKHAHPGGRRRPADTSDATRTVASRKQVQAATCAIDRLHRLLPRANAAAMAALTTLTDILAQQRQELLADTKAEVLVGVRYFEREPAPTRDDITSLQGPLAAIPRRIDRYHTELLDALRSSRVDRSDS